jgi:hypothetical protein
MKSWNENAEVIFYSSIGTGTHMDTSTACRFAVTSLVVKTTNLKS